MVTLNTPSHSSLTPGYTRHRPIGAMTSNAQATLSPEELIWVMQEWIRFTGGPEDEDFNVIMERNTQITGTRVWVVDRDGPESRPMLMLPEDY